MNWKNDYPKLFEIAENCTRGRSNFQIACDVARHVGFRQPMPEDNITIYLNDLNAFVEGQKAPVNVNVSQPMAEFFLKQCIGTKIGDGGPRPINQTLADFFEAHTDGGDIMTSDRQKFASMLRAIADQID